jgi:hypothetical protein
LEAQAVVRRAAGLATRPGNIPHHFDQFSGIMRDVLLTLLRRAEPE